METGSNIVEVPGSKSRKVAGKKQQWYRTAISEMFSSYCNLLYISAFVQNVDGNQNVLVSKLFPYSFHQSNTEGNLFFSTDSETKSVFSLKLQKTIRLLFSGDTVVLVKSYFSSIYKMKNLDFNYMIASFGGRAINLKNR